MQEARALLMVLQSCFRGFSPTLAGVSAAASSLTVYPWLNMHWQELKHTKPGSCSKTECPNVDGQVLHKLWCKMGGSSSNLMHHQ